jgi:hypothetical protein
MNAWLAIVVLNLAYFAVFLPLGVWRHRRAERFETLRELAPKCDLAGWHPVGFRWGGRFRTVPEFRLIHDDGREGVARVLRAGRS